MPLDDYARAAGIQSRSAALQHLEPVRRGEAGKRRPAVIVSNDDANSTATRLGRGVVAVVPVTSNVTKIFPSRLHLAL